MLEICFFSVVFHVEYYNMSENQYFSVTCIFTCEINNCTYFTCIGKRSSRMSDFTISERVKDLYSTAPKRGSVFIGLMTPDGAIWSRYQRTVLMR